MGLGPCGALVVKQVGIHLPVGRVVEELGLDPTPTFEGDAPTGTGV
jgi:hypothetical protein